MRGVLGWLLEVCVCVWERLEDQNGAGSLIVLYPGMTILAPISQEIILAAGIPYRILRSHIRRQSSRLLRRIWGDPRQSPLSYTRASVPILVRMQHVLLDRCNPTD